MAVRNLGSTGIMVSEIGFGAFKIGRNQKTKYAEHYELPDQSEVNDLLASMLDAGLTLIDTAPAYGTSEERIGRFLADSGRRGEVVLSTKVGERFHEGTSHYDFGASAVEASINESLRRLGVDVLDVVNVHSDGHDLRILEETDVLEVLARRRDRGDLRAIGFSGKTLEGGHVAINHPLGVDVLMIELNLEERGQRPLLQEAGARGIGVLVKKGLASGRASAARSLHWLLEHPEVSSVVVGSRSASHMLENLKLAARW